MTIAELEDAVAKLCDESDLDLEAIADMLDDLRQHYQDQANEEAAQAIRDEE
jgi:hypothetical protein